MNQTTCIGRNTHSRSSGKSSVLEALTQLPFPRNPDLCTTFPTQITFRNALQERTIVSIIPAPSSNLERAAELRKYKREYLQSFSGDEFSAILKDVSSIYSQHIVVVFANTLARFESLWVFEIHWKPKVTSTS